VDAPRAGESVEKGDNPAPQSESQARAISEARRKDESRCRPDAAALSATGARSSAERQDRLIREPRRTLEKGMPDQVDKRA